MSPQQRPIASNSSASLSNGAEHTPGQEWNRGATGSQRPERQSLADSPPHPALELHDLGWQVVPARLKTKKPSGGWKKAQDEAQSRAQVEEMFSGPNEKNIFLVTGSQSGVVVLDCDDDVAAEYWGRVLGDALETTTAATTGKGVHFYFRVPVGEVHKGRSRHGTDESGNWDFRADGGGVICPPSVHPSGVLYQWLPGRGPEALTDAPPELWAALDGGTRGIGPEAGPIGGGGRSNLSHLLTNPPAVGGRNVWLTAVCGHYAKMIPFRDAYDAVVATTNALLADPLSATEVHSVADSIWTQEVASLTLEATASATHQFPRPLGEAALHGIAGELLQLLEPNSEADPAGMLISFLVGFGNIVGRGPHWKVNGTEHAANEFTLLVGDTSTGRKGTAVSDGLWVLRLSDPEWFKCRVVSGLSSGEGLVFQVRDPVKQDRKPRKNESVGADGLVVVDPGESDKRLMVVEAEFAQALKQMRREGNTLSPVVRTAWESGAVGTLTKQNPTRATGAHVSVIGQISGQELRAQLDETEVANGFANRFMLVAVRRSKSLPFGTGFSDDDLLPLAARLRALIERARRLGAVGMDDEAQEIWGSEYELLTAPRPGILGAVCGRAHAHVRRLAVLYALLDGDEVVRAVHLRAALEIWRYCEDSARYVFGDRLGNQLSDRLRAEIRAAGDAGLSRTEMRALIGHRTAASAIDEALHLLERAGLACGVRIPTGKRPEDRWYSVEVSRGSVSGDALISSTSSTDSAVEA